MIQKRLIVGLELAALTIRIFRVGQIKTKKYKCADSS